MRRSWIIARHELKVMFGDWSLPMFLMVMPVAIMLVTRPLFQLALEDEGYAFATGAEQAVPGIAVTFSAIVASFAGFTFFRDHGWRTWDRLRAATSTAELLLGKLLPPLVVAIVQLILLFVLGVLFVGLTITGSHWALLVAAVTLSLCFQAFAAAAAAVARSAQHLNVIWNVGGVVFVTLGGALVPLSLLPNWVTAIAPAVPTFWAMQAFRGVILDGAMLRDVLLPSAILLGFAVGFVGVALLRFRLNESKQFWI